MAGRPSLFMGLTCYGYVSGVSWIAVVGTLYRCIEMSAHSISSSPHELPVHAPSASARRVSVLQSGWFSYLSLRLDGGAWMRVTGEADCRAEAGPWCTAGSHPGGAG